MDGFELVVKILVLLRDRDLDSFFEIYRKWYLKILNVFKLIVFDDGKCWKYYING